VTSKLNQGEIQTGWLALPAPFDRHFMSVTVLTSAVKPNQPTRCSIVICEPFGIEGLASDAALNALSYALVRSGHPVIRFRPPGLGDASDLEPDESILPTWEASLVAAMALARQLSGDVSVFGLRLGATIAAHVLATLADVKVHGTEAVPLVMWAPVTGKTFVREQRLLRAAGSHQGALQDAQARNASPLSDGSIEAGGFRLSAASIHDLASRDFLGLATGPKGNVLIVDRDDLPGAARIAEHFRTIGVNTELANWPGFAATRIDDPESGVVPNELINSCVNWVGAQSRSDAETTPASHAVRREIRISAHARERIVTIDSSVDLHGMVTEPENNVNSQVLPVVIMLTTGANCCAGAGRVHAELARQFARNGIRSIRIDRHGVGITWLIEAMRTGEAAGMPNPVDHTLNPPVTAYDDCHLAAVSDIERYVSANFGNSGYVLLGICSGAYVAFNAAHVGANPRAIVSVNQIIFDLIEWQSQPDWKSDVGSPMYALKAWHQLKHSILKPDAWKAVLRGDVPIGRTVQRLINYVRIRKAPTDSSPTNSTEVNDQMRRMGERGIRQIYLFDEAEVGLPYLSLKAQGTIRTLEHDHHYTLKTTQGAGHTFATVESRQWLKSTIETSLLELGSSQPEGQR
jgi:pimeloyl-ACP methyl ester carboxylesterase